MKYKILFLFMIMVMSIGLMCSCFKKGKDDGGDKDPDTSAFPENGIYTADSELYLIREEGFDEEIFLELLGELESVRGNIVNLAATDSEKHAHEIVIGDTGREISNTARQKLDRIEKNKDTDVGFLIYSDGSSVAIVFDGDPEGITVKMAIDHFIENYVKNELILAEGVAYQTTFDLIEGYAASVDEAYKNEMWALMEETVGADHGKSFVAAMKSLYSIYSSDMILWLANLYEPGVCVCNGLYGEDVCKNTKYCGTSAFYYSNSARDTAGYLPDVETTYQALMLLNSTGVTRVSGGWKNMLDPEMLEKMGNFIRSIQVEDGNFIHPQWAHLEVGISRKSRDLKWATELLEMMNIRPYYTTPTGIPGIGAPKATSAMPLGGSKVSMVSAAVMTAGHLPELDSDVSFRNYLEAMDIKYNSYAKGNQISSILGQITARDAELRKEGKDYQLIDILIEFLNENRNTETGTWDHTPKTDPKYSVYEGVNGLMKISAAYNVAKVPIPYASEACDSAIAAITAEETVGEVVDVYNPWHALTVIFGNLTDYGTDSDRAMVATLRQKLYSLGTEVLGATRERALLFAHEDGSFSYNKGFSAPNSQGCPAAVLNSREGDVNGTVLGSSGLLDYVYSALGLKSCKVPLFGETERIMFMSELRSMNPGKKPPEDLSYVVEDFEDDVVGEEPAGLDISTKVVSEGASIKVVNRADGQGKALAIDSKYYKDNSESVTVACRSKSNLAKTFVFEGDFCVNSTDRYYSAQIKMGAAYMLALRWENHNITLWETSSSSNSKAILTKFDPTVALGEWFRIKVEYYCGDASSVRIKVYFDNLADSEEMKLIAVTDNYYDEKGYKLNGNGTPASTFDGTQIYVMSDCTMNMLADNLASYKSDAPYVPYTDVNAPLSFNVDSPDRQRELYDYESGIPTAFRDANGGVKAEGGSLTIGSETAESRVTIPLNLRTKTANAAILDTKISFRSADAGKDVLTLVGVENTGNVFGFKFKLSEDGSYAQIYEYPGALGALLPGAKIPTDSLTSLRVEYYQNEDTALIYVGGEFVGASGASYTGGANRTAARLTLIVPKETAVTLDDTVAERDLLDYSAATKPTKDPVVHNFDTGADKDALSGGATLVTTGNGGYVKMDSGTKAAAIALPVVHRSNISSLLMLELDFTLNSVKRDGQTHRIVFKDSDGADVYSLAILSKNKTVGVYEIGLSGIADSPLASFALNESVKLSIKYFAEEKTTYIYKNGIAVARTNIISSLTDYRKIPETVEISSADVGSVASVDNIRCETLYESFSLFAVSGETNTETGKITFENSSSGSLPSHLYSVLNSDKAALRVEEMTDKDGNYTNAATFVTGQENNDSLGIVAEEDLSGYSAVTFEVDFKIDNNQSSNIYQIFFTKEGSADIAYQLVILRDSDTGKIYIEDWSSSSRASSERINLLASGIDPKVWNTLKVEYFKGTSDTVRIRISLNGEVVFVSDNYYSGNTSAPRNNISKVYFYSFFSTEGTVYADNISLYGTNGTCTDAVGAR